MNAMRILRPNRCLAARMRRRSELSRTTAIRVITVIATGEEKLRIMTASWSKAAPMAQTITVEAAQNSPVEPFRTSCALSALIRFQATNQALRERYENRAAQTHAFYQP